MFARLFYYLRSFFVEENQAPFRLIYHCDSGTARTVKHMCQYANIPIDETKLAGESSEVILEVYDSEKDFQIKQPAALLRYIGRYANLYPGSAMRSAIVDEWMDMHRDFALAFDMHARPGRYGLDWNEASAASHMDWCKTVHLPRYLNLLESHIFNRDTIAELEDLTVADFSWFAVLTGLRAGAFKGIDESDFAEFPNVLDYLQFVESETEVVDRFPEQCEPEAEKED